MVWVFSTLACTSARVTLAADSRGTSRVAHSGDTRGDQDARGDTQRHGYAPFPGRPGRDNSVESARRPAAANRASTSTGRTGGAAAWNGACRSPLSWVMSRASSVCRGRSSGSARITRRRSMARATRDLTVVTGWPRAAAISENVRSSSESEGQRGPLAGDRAGAGRRPGIAPGRRRRGPRRDQQVDGRRRMPAEATVEPLAPASSAERGEGLVDDRAADPGREAIGRSHRAGRLQQPRATPAGAGPSASAQVAGNPVGDPDQRTFPATYQHREEPTGRPPGTARSARRRSRWTRTSSVERVSSRSASPSSLRGMGTARRSEVSIETGVQPGLPRRLKDWTIP